MQYLDDRQITHLICVRLKHLLSDFWGGVLGLLPVVSLYRRPKTAPRKVTIANVLGEHRLDEQSGGALIFSNSTAAILEESVNFNVGGWGACV